MAIAAPTARPLLPATSPTRRRATAELQPPVFLIGNYRSGTTITQKLIGLHPEIVTWYEPRTLWLYADPRRRHDEFSAEDATPPVVRYLRRRFLRFQGRNGGRRIMENTPSNVLRVPYVHAIFPEAAFLYMTRNPFSCISSMELKWQRTKTWAGIRRTVAVTPATQLHHYAGVYLKQLVAKKVLRRKYSPLYGPRYRGIDADLGTLSKLQLIARQWARGNRKAREDLAALGPGRALVFRYEDLMEETGATLRRIYDHCGLTLTGDIVRQAERMVDPGRQKKWLRLDPEELRDVLPELREEMAACGYEVPRDLR